MKFYFAPMEGITGYVFRNAHHACFPSVDRYYTPFISPNQNRPMSPKEKRDVLPDMQDDKTHVLQSAYGDSSLNLINWNRVRM